MIRALGAVTGLAFLVVGCASAKQQAEDADLKRSPRWSSAIVTGGSVRGGGD